MPRIKKIGLLLVGRAGSGKDTIGNIINKRLGIKKYNIADALKIKCATHHNLPIQVFYSRNLKDNKMLFGKTKSPRDLLIEMANEKKHIYGEYYFISNTCNNIHKNNNNESFTIADCRFPDESEYIKSFFKTTHNIKKIWIDRKIKNNIFDNLHLREKDCDITIDNNKPITDEDYEDYIIGQLNNNKK